MNFNYKTILFPFIACFILDIIGLFVHREYNLLSYIAFYITILLAYKYTKKLRGEE